MYDSESIKNLAYLLTLAFITTFIYDRPLSIVN
jgi:hypothetical protein